ncbi:DUF805 domain-containing protein [Pacificimonas sp. WHA3]|uniref:DUF805 domain-containing protein n=2 Tax=Pacificimonas pallii TaxID=2827236 RepID=A0ABS6SH04_9SPHN|nr:DUF805 domain-containing protein [Pacificimonas pallii]MBV7257692.1 DUF805 domain-containing protein [Pacificimonas pallii]
MEWMLMPLKRYADFNGRSRRKEYWMFLLGYIVVYVVLGLLTGGFGTDPNVVGSMLLLIFSLGLLIPSLAVGVRRLHDLDKSGWFLLIGIIPIIGSLILLYFFVQDGTPGPNKYGPNPKGPDNEALQDAFS